MQIRSKFSPWPALVIGALMGATSVAALTPAFVPAYATTVQPGGYADLVTRVAPGVVYIEVTKTAANAGISPVELLPGAPQGETNPHFGTPGPGQPNGPQKDAPMETGVGTGFIVSAGGDIVTNNHVVEGADKVTVRLSDGTSLDAAVIGTDAATDLALIRVEAGRALPHVTWGDSRALRVGQDVVAIGNPFGLGNSVTTGIVSALGRDISSGPFDNYIQTDAAINRGNSGGPLFDAAGTVVGINTAIVSPSGGSVGIGFAMPSDTARTVIADLSDDGRVARGWLGVSVQPVTADIAAAIGLQAATGALISDVTADAPAALAGLRRGDVVTAVDGTIVETPRDLTRIVAGAKPGTKITITLLRAGNPTGFAVKLGERPDQPDQPA